MLFRRRRRPLLDEFEVDEIVTRWARACEGAGLVREVQTVSGPTVMPPRIVHVVTSVSPAQASRVVHFASPLSNVVRGSPVHPLRCAQPSAVAATEGNLRVGVSAPS